MKQLFPILLVVLMGVSSAQACIKKTKAAKSECPQTELTVIVMDTTQALLPDAEVKVGKTVLHTRWDGKVVLTPAMLSGVKKIQVSCNGYESSQQTLDNVQKTMLIVLTPKKNKERTYGDGRVRDAEEPMYRTLGLTSAKSGHVMASMAADEYEFAEIMEVPEMPATGAAANQVSAGLLTAGEVNDFAKWELWKKLMENGQWNFNDGQKSKNNSEWGITPKERFTVQVKNEAGYPIAGYPVSLTDGQGNTLFQAVTDNTGKAELWGNLTGEGLPVTGYRIRLGDRIQEAKAWQTIVVEEACGASEAVEVLFVFDATGSMGDELRYLQAEMKDVIARATQATGGLHIRTGAVVYRDHGDDYVTRISRLTSDIAVTQTFIDKQEAGGGGDYPEAVPEALMAALNSAGWDENSRARIAFLILDAPCHQDSATLALLHEQILNAAAMGVRIVPVVCSGLSKSGEYLMRSIALATNGTSFFLTDDSGIGHEHLKPTTDSMTVEHLNDMLVRTIVEFSSMPDCTPSDVQILPAEVNDQFIPNPFETSDLQADPTLPHGEGIAYLVDISGKLLGIYEGEVPTSHLSTGVYFIKKYINGQWYTQKMLVR